MNRIRITLFFTLIVALVAVAIYFGVKVRQERIATERIEALIEAPGGGALSSEGARTKEELIAPLNGAAGTLLETDSMAIGYLSPPDEMILVLINSVAVEDTEEQAISWLLSRGFSRADLCNIPVIFSITNPAAQTPKEYKLEANYLPEYCLE